MSKTILNSNIHPANSAISLEPVISARGLIGPATHDTSSFLCNVSKTTQLLRISLLPFLTHLQRFSILLSIFSMTLPSDSIGISGPQALLPSHLATSFVGVSGRRSAIEPLTSNPSDASFAFSDAPTLALISQIVSAPDSDSNEYKLVSSRLSGPYFYVSTFWERLRHSRSSFDFLRPFSTFFDIQIRAISSISFFSTFLDLLPNTPTFFELLRPCSIFEFVGFNRFLLPLSSSLRALLRLCPTLFELIQPS
jgi:hypothetical protein